MRDTTDVVEGMGIALALKRAESADLRVFLAEDGEEFEVRRMPGDIVVLPKADQRADKTGAVSGVTGEGLDRLVSDITGILRDRSASAGLATRERHRAAMVRAQTALNAARDVLSLGPDHYDIAAEELRHAIRALESLVGRVDVENLLDEIFASFCLGK